jgi:hypothetical protein
MNVSCRLDEDETESQIPLFKLKEGVSTSSEGIPCARNAGDRIILLSIKLTTDIGVSDDILRRAEDIKNTVSRQQLIHPLPRTNSLLNEDKVTSFVRKNTASSNNTSSRRIFFC